MNDSRFAWKVGFFVFIGLAVAALLILNFSKGVTLFQSTYHLHVEMPNVAGLKPAADVMVAGVPIGKVQDTILGLDGRSVDVKLEVLGKYKIRRDATFHIDAQGFLGDPYVEVTPPETNPPAGQPILYLTNGEVVVGEAPFNMQEAVRSVSGLLDSARKTIKDIDTAVTNVNQTVLTADTLTRVSLALSNFDSVTIDAAVMAGKVRSIIDSNAVPVNVAVSNFVALSDRLNAAANQLGQTIANNTNDVAVAVSNLRSASVSIKEIADGLQAGQGVAGGLLKDEKMRDHLNSVLTNLDDVTAQFSLFGLHLNQNGLWHMLWKPKPPETNAPHR